MAPTLEESSAQIRWERESRMKEDALYRFSRRSRPKKRPQKKEYLLKNEYVTYLLENPENLDYC
jgi:hypothetical protein